MRRKLVSVSLLFIVILAINNAFAQDLEKHLAGKTFVRHFSAAGFPHVATYKFYANKVVYSVKGFFIRDTYQIVGRFQGNKFIGIEPKTKKRYVLEIKVLDNRRIKIYKYGVDEKYRDIVRLFPVKGWHVYTLNR